MQGERANRWRNLCEQAAIEKDPEKLLDLTKEIISLLDEKEQRPQREQEQENAVGRCMPTKSPRFVCVA